MGVPGMTRSKLTKPQYFLEEKTKEVEIAIGSDTSPNFLGDPYEGSHKKSGGWVQFIVPKEQLIVSLRLPFKGKPYHARQEWMMRHERNNSDGEQPFDERARFLPEPRHPGPGAPPLMNRPRVPDAHGVVTRTAHDHRSVR